MKDKPFAQQVREKYGDSVEEFALRMGVHTVTVSAWESGVTPQSQVLALLIYANEYDMPIRAEAGVEFQNMTMNQLIKYLKSVFDDTDAGLAVRLGLSKHQVSRISRRPSVNKSTKRLILEAVAHPDRFMKYPKAFSK